jgi:flagellin-like hook-associated protein FlgL
MINNYDGRKIMSQISLTASMRSNLLSLQNTSKLMDQTQERLSSGKKVNSAIDNPSSYYTAQSLTNRASDLSGLLDSMGQAVSTIKAANEGIESITTFVEQAKAVATAAVDTTDANSRAQYMQQFNDILDQIDQMAFDSSYKGINLLKGDQLTVTFNEGRTNKLDIQGVNADSTGLSINNAAWGTDVTTSVTDDVKALDVSAGTHDAVATDAYFAYGDTIYKNTSGEEIGANAAVTDLSKYTKIAEVTVDGATKYYDVSNTTAVATQIKTSIDETADAINTLRDYASNFGNNYSIVQTREDFTTNLINVLEEGADKLTLADMNEESANMLALQTRQQLAINSLSLASQAAQSVLKLF